MPGLPAPAAGSAPLEGSGDAPNSTGPLEDDAALRSRLSLAFAQALRQAEEDSSAMASKKSPSSIAEEAYKKLCYDFPMLDTEELDALALVIKSNLAVNGRYPFAVSSCVVAGLGYLSGTIKQPRAAGSAADLDVISNDEADKRGDALATILACILVVAPSRALVAAAADNGKLLRGYLGSYRIEAGVEPSDPAPHPLAGHAPGEVASQEEPGQLEDDSDSDWEPLEPVCSRPVSLPQGPLLAPPSDGDTLSGQELVDRLTSLSAHLRYETLACHSVWADPSLALMDSLVDLVTHLPALEQQWQAPVAPVRRAYLALLGNRLGACPGGTGRFRDSAVSVLPRVLPSLGPAASSASLSAPAFLASLVARLESAPPSSSGLLWPAVQDALPLLAAHVQAVAGQATMSAEGLAELEAGMRVLAFFVEAAPGNADVGQPLLQSGIFRDARTLFLRVGAAPAAEQLRRFLLLAVVASPALARFNTAALPPLSSLTNAPAFLDPHSPASLHAALWPMLLHAGGTASGWEQQAAQIVRDPVAEEANQNIVASAGALARLHRFLSLLQAVVPAAPGERPIWTRNGALEEALVDTSAGLAAARGRTRRVPAEGEAPGEADSAASLSSDIKDTSMGNGGQQEGREETEGVKGLSDPIGEVKSSRNESRPGKDSSGLRSSAEEKVLDLVPTVLRQLKTLISYSKGGATGKSD